MKKSEIARESIVAARSVVRKAFLAPHSLVGDNPSRLLRTIIQWFRNGEQEPLNSVNSNNSEAYHAEVSDHIGEISEETVWPSWPKNTVLFFGMGAMKSGTTWLFDYLNKNPDVHFSPVKEVHYWDVIRNRSDRHHYRAKATQLAEASTKLLDCSIAEVPGRLENVKRALSSLEIYSNSDSKHVEYKNYLLQGYKGQRAVGDLTPSYCTLDRETLIQMSTLTSNVKFIFVMRDPVERLWSAIRMGASRVSSNPDELTRNCGIIINELRDKADHFMLTRSDYKSTISALDETIDQENVAYLFFERMFENKTLKYLCDFLGIRFSQLNGPTKVVRKGERSELDDSNRQYLNWLLRGQYEFLEQRFEQEIPNEWYKNR